MMTVCSVLGFIEIENDPSRFVDVPLFGSDCKKTLAPTSGLKPSSETVPVTVAVCDRAGAPQIVTRNSSAMSFPMFFKT